MQGEFNGLQRKILDINPHAYYVHCFAHQLQLVVVSIATSACCQSVHDFFEYIHLVVTTRSSSCKRRDALKEKHHHNILEKLERGEILSGRGVKQETNCDTQFPKGREIEDYSFFPCFLFRVLCYRGLELLGSIH
jgi:hypothetical protein